MSQLIRRVAKKGFTLIELMIVVAIIGILAAIAVPKFADLILKSKESSAKGALGSLRSALTIYYSDMEGTWPATLADLPQGGRYVNNIPTGNIPKHSMGVGNIGHTGRTSAEVAVLTDASAASWIYVVATGASAINCSHVDTKGTIWSWY
ncbi:MAG: prepilin-type N-terminal cleavage/methylation domain-containing protein [Elusimicrobia bacterium]|nr:prepilin-type N-terminal cleavage/methylation domain-containing protein [Elusimicrobiota bacterium]